MDSISLENLLGEKRTQAMAGKGSQYFIPSPVRKDSPWLCPLEGILAQGPASSGAPRESRKQTAETPKAAGLATMSLQAIRYKPHCILSPNARTPFGAGRGEKGGRKASLPQPGAACSRPSIFPRHQSRKDHQSAPDLSQLPTVPLSGVNEIGKDFQ